MSRILGKGRYVYGTYPQSPSAGGGGSSGAPLSRQRFIDGGTLTPGEGAASAPFRTIAAFMAARAPATDVDDASVNYVGWLMPAVAGYSAVAFPKNLATELRADSFTSVGFSGTTIGTVTWDNSGDVAPVATIPLAALHNIFVSGDFTVTDDGAGPASVVSISGDELFQESSGVSGSIIATGSTKLSTVLLSNAGIGGDITIGEAAAQLFGSVCVGDISADSITSENSEIGSGHISAVSGASFTNTKFSPGHDPILAVSAGNAVFDGPSWLSFLQAGGTRGTTPVLVVGGYNGAAVEGTTIIASGATATVSLDGTGSPTIADGGNHYTVAIGIAAPVSVTLLDGGALPGDTILISKTDTAAEAVTVKNSSGVTIGTITSGSRGFVLAQFKLAGVATDWVMVQGGALPA
jgi:hypothetical protein